MISDDLRPYYVTEQVEAFCADWFYHRFTTTRIGQGMILSQVRMNEPKVDQSQHNVVFISSIPKYEYMCTRDLGERLWVSDIIVHIV